MMQPCSFACGSRSKEEKTFVVRDIYYSGIHNSILHCYLDLSRQKSLGDNSGDTILISPFAIEWLKQGGIRQAAVKNQWPEDAVYCSC